MRNVPRLKSALRLSYVTLILIFNLCHQIVDSNWKVSNDKFQIGVWRDGKLLMDSYLSSTASVFTDDPIESSDTYESWTSAGTLSYASPMTSRKQHQLNSTDASFSAVWNSTFATSTNDSGNITSPTEPMVTTGDEPKKRRRTKRTDDSSSSNSSFQSPESLIVSQCDAPHCYCSNLSTTNLEYNIQHGEIALLSRDEVQRHGVY